MPQLCNRAFGWVGVQRSVLTDVALERLHVAPKNRVRVVVPLRVIEELDAKKYATRDDLASRTRWRIH